jgi:predicted transcriptional regulator
VRRSYRGLTRSGQGLAKLLGDLEREIMELMWERGHGSVRLVLDALNRQRPPDHQLAYTTVMTVMAKLAGKGLLRRERVGRADEYHVAETRDAFLRRSSENLTRQLVEDFGDAAISSFVDILEAVAPERLEQLRRKAQSHDES